MKSKAVGIMLILSLIGALNFPLGKMALASFSPHMYVAVRFNAAFLILAFLYRKRLKKEIRKEVVFAAGIVGVVVWLSYILTTIGLQYTTSSNAGFLSGMYLIIVPLIECCIKRKKLSGREIWGVAVAVLGLAVLSIRAGFSVSGGDLLVLTAAACTAIGMVLMGNFAMKYDPIIITIIEIGVIGLLALPAGGTTEAFKMPIVTPKLILMMIVLILGCTIVCTLGQNIVLSILSPFTVALILITQPVFAALLSTVILGEWFGLKEILGSGLIMLSMMIIICRKEH